MMAKKAQGTSNGANRCNAARINRITIKFLLLNSAHQNSTPGIETFVIKRPNLVELSHGPRRRDQNIRLIVPRPRAMITGYNGFRTEN